MKLNLRNWPTNQKTTPLLTLWKYSIQFLISLQSYHKKYLPLVSVRKEKQSQYWSVGNFIIECLSMKLNEFGIHSYVVSTPWKKIKNSELCITGNKIYFILRKIPWSETLQVLKCADCISFRLQDVGFRYNIVTEYLNEMAKDRNSRLDTGHSMLTTTNSFTHRGHI